MEYEATEVAEETTVVPYKGTKAINMLRSFISPENHTNIVSLLDPDVVSKIGSEVTRGYDVDKASRADWERQTQAAMDLAMQVTQEKSWPWPKAANVKYPLITTAAIQFSARAYPAIVAGQDVVKGEVVGPDEDGQKKERATRIGRHMSYQLLEEIADWDEEEDKLLLMMAIAGCAFRKTYFDSMLGRPCSDLISAKDVVYDHATPWKKLRRVSHLINLFKNDVIERVRGGIYADIKLDGAAGTDYDEDEAIEFIEQHCWYDLDEDGYKEPYIVTVNKQTSEVARIIARFDAEGIYLNSKNEISKIKPVEYFTKFAFMPNPDGGSYDVGLGMLLNPINESINTVLNQMMDAGTLANTGGGFIGSGLKMKGGVARFAPGEYKPVDVPGGKIADSIYHMQHSGPSAVLFQLLGMLIQAGKEMSSVQDIMTGEQQANQTATTTMALIEQGQKVFSAIYKRVHRSLKQEFKKLYRLNKLYLEPEDYYRYLDRSEPIYLEDYQGDATDVCPVSDPSLVSDAQKLARAEALMKFMGDPFFKQRELRVRYLKAIKEENIETLLIGEEEEPISLEQIEQEKAQVQQGQQMLQQKEQELVQMQQGMAEEANSLELVKKDIEISVQQLQAQEQDLNRYANEVKLHEQLALERINAERAKLDAEVKTREAELNQLVAEKMEKIGKSELEFSKLMFEKQSIQETKVPIEQSGQTPINIIVEKNGTIKRTVNIQAPSGQVYTGTIEDTEIESE
jgi:chaperonin GroES